MSEEHTIDRLKQLEVTARQKETEYLDYKTEIEDKLERLKMLRLTMHEGENVVE